MHGLSTVSFSRGRGVLRVSSLLLVCSKSAVIRQSGAWGGVGKSSFFLAPFLVVVDFFLVPFFVVLDIFFFVFVAVPFLVLVLILDLVLVSDLDLVLVVDDFRFVVVPLADFFSPLAYNWDEECRW